VIEEVAKLAIFSWRVRRLDWHRLAQPREQLSVPV
jgi:hypothetical protein